MACMKSQQVYIGTGAQIVATVLVATARGLVMQWGIHI